MRKNNSYLKKLILIVCGFITGIPIGLGINKLISAPEDEPHIGISYLHNYDNTIISGDSVRAILQMYEYDKLLIVRTPACNNDDKYAVIHGMFIYDKSILCEHEDVWYISKNEFDNTLHNVGEHYESIRELTECNHILSGYDSLTKIGMDNYISRSSRYNVRLIKDVAGSVIGLFLDYMAN